MNMEIEIVDKRSNKEEEKDSDNSNTGISNEDVSDTNSKEESDGGGNSEEGSQIYVIKVTTNKEDRALEMISDKVKKKSLDVYSITRPHGLRGYIFLEANLNNQ